MLRWVRISCTVLLGAVVFAVSLSEAQTVVVDTTASHAANRFSPLRALGSTVDRIPSNATEVFFRPDQIQKVLSAGWGVISYRQNKISLYRQSGTGIQRAHGAIRVGKDISQGNPPRVER